MEIKEVEVKKLKAYKYNPRKDLKKGDLAYEQIKRSIDEFGYVEPIVWNKKTGNVVGGHQRLKVLKEKGLARVEVSIVDIDEESEKALNIALNKIGGEWDNEKLAIVLSELSDKMIRVAGIEQYEEDIIRQRIDLNQFYDDDDREKDEDEEWVTCPNCGHKFIM